MKKQLEKWETRMKEKFGLSDYTLGRTNFFRTISANQQTQYTYSMEWFPEGVEREDEDTNPKGTASIEVDVHTGELLSFIAVGGVLYADSVRFQNEQEVRGWIEKEAGVLLSHSELQIEEEGEYRFINTVDGIPTTPGAEFRVRLNSEGKLTLFSQLGHFTKPELVEREPFTLTIENVRDISMNQLHPLEYPIVEEERLVSIFGIDEIYITNDGESTLPFLLSRSNQQVTVEKVMTYEPLFEGHFQGERLNFSEEVTLEQVEKGEPHPDLRPITKEEAGLAEGAVIHFLRTEFPEDSGKWSLKTLEREHGYVMAILKQEDAVKDLFQGKLKVMLSPDGREVINFLDSAVFEDMMKGFTPAPEPHYTKDQAFERLKERFELRPRYVLDQKTGTYKLCGLLDCNVALDAHTGKVISL
ncbi:hypothetical protein EQV77_09450 [Halobacillus fulvus]|nr:hypothetical protein EQV77_09450 [Halobacillus fulvus]